jgi:hypothetical protein
VLSDAYAGYNTLAKLGRQPAPVISADCWTHGRRELFKIAERDKAPLAIEAMRRIDAIFEAERAINGTSAEHRLAIRQINIVPLVDELFDWMRECCRRMSTKNPVTQAMNYFLKRADTFTSFLTDGRICLSNNAEERAAAMYSLIVTARLNNVDPQSTPP